MNKFKVGDKIRFIGNKESLTDYAVPDELHGALLKPGSFFIVLEYSPRDGVRLEGFGEWWVQNEAVELAPATLQLAGYVVATEHMVHAQELYHQCLSLRGQCFNLGMSPGVTHHLAEAATALQTIMGEEITKQKN